MGNAETINALVDLCLRSARIRRLVVAQEAGERDFRPQVHLLLKSPPGSTKSSILVDVRLAAGVQIYTNITRAALVGSIDKQGEVIEPAAWTVRNRVLLLDEYNVDGDSSAVEALLQLMEGARFTRKIARTAKDVSRRDKELFWTVKKSTLDFQTRFACIITSMKQLEKSYQENTHALISRCLVWEFTLTPDEFEHISEGHSLVTVDRTIFEAPLRDVYVSNKDYKLIKSVIKNYPTRNPIVKNYLRALGDCVRAFAVYGRHDEHMYNLILKIHDESPYMG